jgi:hypothetical protein
MVYILKLLASSSSSSSAAAGGCVAAVVVAAAAKKIQVMSHSGLRGSLGARRGVRRRRRHGVLLSHCCSATSSTGNGGPHEPELRLAIVTWIERTYRRRRRRFALGQLTATEFELLHTPVATAV